MNLDSLITGQSETHLVEVPRTNFRLHQDTLAPFQRLQKKASAAGFELEIVSAYRGFEAQLKIWNEKATGKRALLDENGQPLDPDTLSARETIYAILNWSALPGASRHHWGTDFDVIDRKAAGKGYKVQLTPEESDGIFGPMHRWLDAHLEEEGFYRPYQEDLGGVKPERWHLSHAAAAQPLFEGHSEGLLKQTLVAAPLLLKQEVLAELPAIFDRFFRRVAHAPGN